MTPERKNEIWAMLPSDFKEYVQHEYSPRHMFYSEAYTRGYREAFEDIFGLHNLTAPAEDDKSNGKSQGIGFTPPSFKLDVKPSREIPLDIAESGETSTKEDAYFAYRLNLAKEIAVAMLPYEDKWDIKTAPVNIANRIVKHLKETEDEY